MKEIVIITANRTGLLADVSEVLAGGGINIESIDGEEVGAAAVVTLTVDRYDLALQKLRDAGFDAITEDVLVIRLRDEPGALARIARRFKDAGIDLRSVRILYREQNSAYVALATERTYEARQLVQDCLVHGPEAD